MSRIEQAVGEWRRVYMRLCAAQDRLRGGAVAPTDDPDDTGEDPAGQVSRLQDEEQQALRAIDAALLAARADLGSPPSQSAPS